jgi:hypothetical protein
METGDAKLARIATTQLRVQQIRSSELTSVAADSLVRRSIIAEETNQSLKAAAAPTEWCSVLKTTKLALKSRTVRASTIKCNTTSELK